MKKPPYKSDAFDDIHHASARTLLKVGTIDKATMSNFDETYLIPAPKISTYGPSGEKNLFDNYKICPTLDAKHTCIVVEQYSHGKMTIEFHEHVPYRRLSDDARRNLLKMLMVNFSKIDANSLLSYFVNKRGKNPLAADMNWVCSYPEAGVIRTSCGTNTRAWSDQVIDKSKFRKNMTLLTSRPAVFED
jgi:hypothetical protein